MPGYAIRFSKGKQTMEVLYCFGCKDFIATVIGKEEIAHGGFRSIAGNLIQFFGTIPFGEPK